MSFSSLALSTLVKSKKKKKDNVNTYLYFQKWCDEVWEVKVKEWKPHYLCILSQHIVYVHIFLCCMDYGQKKFPTTRKQREQGPEGKVSDLSQ